MTLCSLSEWIAAECPRPAWRIIERAAAMACSMLPTRAKASTGQSFSRTSFSSGCTRSTGVTRIFAPLAREARLPSDHGRILADHRRC